MAAAVTDKFTKGPANKSTTLSSSISDSVQTIPLSNVTGVPTDTAVYIAIDAHDSAGTETPSTAEVVKGVISGSNLINATRGAEGTAQAHDAGAVVEFFWTAAALGDMTDGILVEHAQDGTHTDITADSITINASGSVDFSNAPLATADIADDAVTAAKINSVGTSWTPTVTPSGSMTYTGVTTSAIYIDMGTYYVVDVRSTGTVGGTPSNTFTITNLPFTAVTGTESALTINVSDNGSQQGGFGYVSGSDSFIVRKYDGSNYTAGTAIFRVNGIIRKA